MAAAMSTASELDLAVDDAIVLSDSNRLVIRLRPCDIVARITPMTHFASAEREVELVRRLAQTDSPVAALEARVEPRVFVHDGFKIAMWAYFEPVQSRMLPRAEYAQALACLHAGLRRIEVTTTDRALLANTLRDLGRSIVNRRAPEQLLHGEPHPGNILNTKNGRHATPAASRTTLTSAYLLPTRQTLATLHLRSAFLQERSSSSNTDSSLQTRHSAAFRPRAADPRE
ncbi:hypothetical protein [Actinopolymorpha pittospori]|uniref:Aminoglycoside phosphotransferase domain-containing protein n=1 Tax=Actinopolymorpha pittospori TaxID=648752 RepID=A0A927MNR0_9ACTN|nr:hypothetical protein [Actinopolymorpha pittospori]